MGKKASGNGLTYFTHEIDGRLHEGWYRRALDNRVDVCTRTQRRLEFLNGHPVEDAAHRALTGIVRETGS